MNELGTLLRETRQKNGLILAEVSRATHIKQSYLEALEDGEYGLLPGPAYVTGFLRNYANFLGLHPDDVVQEYNALRPSPQPAVKAATRVLASGHERAIRTRLWWVLATLVLLLAGGFAIKQYNDTYAHAYQAPMSVTPANLGASLPPPNPRPSPKSVRVHLQATAPVWVRVTVDGRQAFQGKLQPRMHHKVWSARHAIFVLTKNGSAIRVIFDGRDLGLMADTPGLMVGSATPAGWHRVS